MLTLNDIVLINESPDEAMPGEISIYESATQACAALEHWWVEQSEGFALAASGDRLILGVDSKGRVIIEAVEPFPDGQSLAAAWLTHAATAVRDAQKDDRPIPASLVGLIGYIGFSR